MPLRNDRQTPRSKEQELTDALKKLSPEELAKLKTALGGTKVVVVPGRNRLGETHPAGPLKTGKIRWVEIVGKAWLNYVEIIQRPSKMAR